MNILTAIVAGLLGILTLVFAVMLVSAIIFNVKAGKKYRQSLAVKVDQLRLSKMLNALGVDINTYLHTERMVDIQQQMNRCSACENTEKCDDQLSGGSISADEIGFCNNEQSLQEMTRDKHQTG